MLAALLFLASPGLAAPAVNPSTNDPPLRVWFNQNGNYAYADRAKVYAKSAGPGYLVVLRADAAGRVRVLFPLDPADDQRIVAGKKYELKGRGGREAFVADDSTGHGTVFAALSDTPFRVDRFARDGHWDLASLSASRGKYDDAETALRGVVEQMKPTGEKFAYAVATYVVSERYARDRYLDPYDVRWGYDPWWGRRVGFAYGYWGWYRPWF